MAQFPSSEWLAKFKDKLNADERYGHIARNWEGDMLFLIEPEGALDQPVSFYLDLWHGKCRDAYIIDNGQPLKSVFTLKGPYNNYTRLLNGELDPMQALLTRKLSLQGNMAILMRNVPTVLEFVRCAREITDSFI
jgi:putative sterol carrier protein